MQHGARRHDATGRANQQVGQFGSAAHRAPEMIEQWRRGHREANEPLDPPLATQRASAGVVVCRQRSPRRVGMWCTQGVHGMLHQQFAALERRLDAFAGEGVEEIRGVALSRGTLDVLLEAGWIRPGKRRRTPGRPLTWVTTQEFLDHFGLEKIDDLPGLDELKAAGLLDARPRVHVLQPGSGDAEGDGEEPDDADERDESEAEDLERDTAR